MSFAGITFFLKNKQIKGIYRLICHSIICICMNNLDRLVESHENIHVITYRIKLLLLREFIYIVKHLRLCLATAIHNLKCLKITHICLTLQPPKYSI